MAVTDIDLSVGLDVQDAEKTAKQLKKEIDNIFDSRDGESSASLTSIESQMKKNILQVKDLEKELQRLSEIKIAADQFDAIGEQMNSLNKDIEEAHKIYSYMADNKLDFVDIGGEKFGKQDVLDTIKQLTEEYDALEKKQEQLGRIHPEILDGKSMAKVEQQISDTTVKLDTINDRLKQEIVRYREIQNKSNNVKNNTAQTKVKMDQLKDSTDKVRKASGQVNKTMSKGTVNLGKYARKFLGTFGAIFLGVRGLMGIFNKLRSAVLEGFKNLQESGVGKLKEQMNDLKNASTTLKNALAGAFEPIVTSIIPYIQRLVQWLTIAIDKIAQFIAAVSGQKTYIKAIKQVGNAAEKAGNQAKGALGSFDKLNVITTNGGGMFEEVAVSQDMLDAVDEFKKKFEKIKKLIDAVVKNPFVEGFMSVFGNVSDRIKEIVGNSNKLRESILQFISKLDLQTLLNTISSISKMIGTIIGFIADLAFTITNGIIKSVTSFYDNYGTRLAEIINTITGLIGDIAEEITQIIQDGEPLFKIFESTAFTDFVASAIALVTELTAGPLELILTVIRDVLSIFDQTLKDNVEGIEKALETLFETCQPLVDELTQGFQELWDELTVVWEESVKPCVEEIGNVISDIIKMVTDFVNENKDTWKLWGESVGRILREYVFPVLKQFGQLVGAIFELIGTLVSRVWNNILKPFINWLKPTILPVLNVLWQVTKTVTQGIFTSVKVKLDLLTGLIKALCKLIKGEPKEALNEMKKTFETIFGDINKFISDLVENLGKAWEALKSFGKEKTEVLPDGSTSTGGGGGRGFATGGVIPPSVSEHLIKVGDNNHETEVVSPLSTMTQAMIDALSKSGVAGNGNQQIVLQLDGKTFMKAMVKQDREHIKQTGQSYFAY